MLAALKALRHEFAFNVEVIDIDADEDLLALYNELVPVLFGSKNEKRENAIQLCHYFFDAEKVRSFASDV